MLILVIFFHQITYFTVSLIISLIIWKNPYTKDFSVGFCRKLFFFIWKCGKSSQFAKSKRILSLHWRCHTSWPNKRLIRSVTKHNKKAVNFCATKIATKSWWSQQNRDKSSRLLRFCCDRHNLKITTIHDNRIVMNWFL
jgi:hypothetical protein